MRQHFEVLESLKESAACGAFHQAVKQIGPHGSIYEFMNRTNLGLWTMLKIDSIIQNSRSLTISEMYSYFEQLQFAYLQCALESSGRHSIKCSETLADLLLRTDMQIPIRQIKLPHQAVYIEVPKSVKIELVDPDTDAIDRAEEIYVADVTCDDTQQIQRLHEENKQHATCRRMSSGMLIYVTGVGQNCTQGQWLHKQFLLGYDVLDESYGTATIETALRQYQDYETHKNFYCTAAQFVCNLFLYMSQPREESDVEFRPNSRLLAAEKMPRGALREATEDNFRRSKASQVYIVGFKTEDELKKLTQAYTHQGGTKRPHWRRGHWNRYWTGPRDQPDKRKQITKWIKPMIVAGAEAPSTTYIVT